MRERTKDKEMNRFTSWHRIFVGVLLIAVGIGFFLDSFIDYDFDWGDWWPAILIALGVMNVASSRWVGVLLIVVGAAFLVDTLDIVELDIGDYFWPLMLVVAGLFVIFGSRARRRQRGRGSSDDKSSSDDLDVSCVFGGIDHRVTSQQFKGGKVSATFGTAKIDLRRATLANGESTLQVEIIFGSAEIYVPDDWMVNVQTACTFGSVDLRRAQPSEPTATLTLAGSCTFGGITIRD